MSVWIRLFAYLHAIWFGEVSVQARGEQRRKTRERIIAAATEAFALHGVHGTRIAEIAERAGIAYGLVYHHFRNKQEILLAIFAERWDIYVTYIESVRNLQVPFEERMRRLVHFWIETFRHEPHVMAVIVNEVSRSYEFLESHNIADVLRAFTSLEALIQDAVDAGEVRSDLDPQLATYAVLGAADMVLAGYVMGTLSRKAPADFVADEQQMVELIVRGLKAGG